MKLAIFSTDANKFKHFNIRKNKSAPNSVDFVSKSIKHLLDIGYIKKTFQHVYCYSQKLISKLSTTFNFYVIHIPFNYYTYKTLEQKKNYRVDITNYVFIYILKGHNCCVNTKCFNV